MKEDKSGSNRIEIFFLTHIGKDGMLTTFFLLKNI